MPSLDEMFGKPKEQAHEAAADVLPATSAEAQAGTFDSAAGRDIVLVASPFSAEAMDFFNQDEEEVTLESALEDQGPFPQVREDPLAPVGQPALADVDSEVDALTQALGPSIENVSRFGEFGGTFGPSSQLSLSQLREALRAVLKKL